MEKVNKNGDDNTNNSEKNILKRRSSRVMFNKKLTESTELPKIMQSKHDVHHKKEVKRTTTIKAKSVKVNQNQNLNPLEATFLNSYKGFARFKELLIRDGFDDMEALIYAKKKDLLDIMPKKAAIRFYKVLKREKPHWKIVYRKQREQIEIERAEEREREERLKKEEEGWFVGEYGSEEEEDYDDELMHDGFHDGHDDY